MADISLRSTRIADVDGLGSQIQHFAGLAIDGTSSYQHTFYPPKKFEGNTDIWLRVDEVSDNDSDVSGGFDLILSER